MFMRYWKSHGLSASGSNALGMIPPLHSLDFVEPLDVPFHAFPFVFGSFFISSMSLFESFLLFVVMLL